MTKQPTGHGPHRKEIRAWGIRRREVDMHQLALAYYLLARIRIEERRQSDGLPDTKSAGDSNEQDISEAV